MKPLPLKKSIVTALPLVLLLLLIMLAPAGFSETRTVEDIPRPAQEVLHQAQCLMEQGRTDAAIKALEKFQERGKKKCKPGCKDKNGYHHYLVDFFLGSAKYRKGQADSAALDFERAVQKKDDFAQGWLNLGTCCHQCGKMGKAAQSYLRGYEISAEKDPSTLYMAGAAFLAAGNAPQAVDVLGRLLQNHEDKIQPEWKESYARALVTADKHREAIPVLEDLAKTAPEERRMNWQEFLLHEYLLLKMNEQALNHAIWLTGEYPLEPRWWKTLATLRLQRKEYGQALVDMDVYANLEPLTQQETRLMADLYLTLNIPSQALGLYKDLAEKNSGPGVVSNIAYSYQKLQQPEEALMWVENGLKRQSCPKLLALKANLLYSLDRFKEAAQAYESIAENNPECGRSWLMAGYSALYAGEPERARIALARAAKYKCHRQAAKKLLVYLEQNQTP